MITLLITILAGAFIGWIASLIMHTDAQMGALANILAGIIGAWIGSYISGALLGVSFGIGFSPMALLFGVIGACILIAIVRMFSGRRPLHR